MDKVETYRARVAKLHGLATDAGRDPASIGLAYNCAFHMEEAAEHQDGGRLIFTGTAEQRAGDIRDFAEIGTTSIIINLTALDLNAMLDRMEDFATNVVPLTSG
jgi:alkanesulfonate monooxygenase SsuD/methylene tetrahydromethanopterin reductase-like flavin-dependent oxidoreductase (luciferase family)